MTHPQSFAEPTAFLRQASELAFRNIHGSHMSPEFEKRKCGRAFSCSKVQNSRNSRVLFGCVEKTNYQACIKLLHVGVPEVRRTQYVFCRALFVEHRQIGQRSRLTHFLLPFSYSVSHVCLPLRLQTRAGPANGRKPVPDEQVGGLSRAPDIGLETAIR